MHGLAIAVFWILTPCGLVSGYQGFGATYWFYLQGCNFKLHGNVTMRYKHSWQHLVACLVGQLVNYLVYWFFGWLIAFLYGWLVGLISASPTCLLPRVSTVSCVQLCITVFWGYIWACECDSAARHLSLSTGSCGADRTHAQCELRTSVSNWVTQSITCGPSLEHANQCSSHSVTHCAVGMSRAALRNRKPAFSGVCVPRRPLN